MKLDVGQPKLVNVDGMLVEEDALRIAERLAETHPNVAILCVDPELADFNDAPFIVAELCADGQYRRIFEAWQLDERILERVYAADRFTGADLLARIDAQNAAVKKEQHRRYRDEMAEKADLAAIVMKHVDKHSKATFNDPNTGDKVTIYDDRPAERKFSE